MSILTPEEEARRRKAEDQADLVKRIKSPCQKPASPRPGRNDPCPCGSGLKYKKCCLLVKHDKARRAVRNLPKLTAVDLATLRQRMAMLAILAETGR